MIVIILLISASIIHIMYIINILKRTRDIKKSLPDANAISETDKNNFTTARRAISIIYFGVYFSLAFDIIIPLTMLRNNLNLLKLIIYKPLSTVGTNAIILFVFTYFIITTLLFILTNKTNVLVKNINTTDQKG